MSGGLQKKVRSSEIAGAVKHADRKKFPSVVRRLREEKCEGRNALLDLLGERPSQSLL